MNWIQTGQKLYVFGTESCQKQFVEQNHNNSSGRHESGIEKRFFLMVRKFNF